MNQQDLQRRVLEESRLTLTELAKVLGVSRSSMEKYHQGDRRMPKEIRRKLAAYLREHAARVSDLADALDPDS